MISGAFPERALRASHFGFPGCCSAGACGGALTAYRGTLGWKYVLFFFSVMAFAGILTGLHFGDGGATAWARSEVVPLRRLAQRSAFVAMIAGESAFTFPRVFISWGVDFAPSYKDFRPARSSVFLSLIMFPPWCGVLVGGSVADRLPSKFA